MAYLGQNGREGQAVVISGGTPAWTGSSRPVYDANHVAAWDMATSDGSSFAASVGSVALTGGSGDVASSYENGIYRRTKAGVYTGATSRPLTANGCCSIGTTTPMTFETFIFAAANGLASSSPDMRIVGPSPTYTYTRLTFSFAVGNLTWIVDQGGSGTPYNIGLGANYNNFLPNVPHHLMIVWIPSVSTKLYIDGNEVANAGARPRAAILTNVEVDLAPTSSVADVRLSNIARDAAYARSAYRVMLGM